MAWSNSKVFAALLETALGNSVPIDLDGDSFKVALYNNSITPDNTVTAENSAYDVGQWADTNEQTSSTDWPAGGPALSSVTWTRASNVVTWDAADKSSGSAATLTNVYGCLVYDDTMTASPGPADQGICYNYFGGAASVTNGTFTIVWNASGIATFTAS